MNFLNAFLMPTLLYQTPTEGNPSALSATETTLTTTEVPNGESNSQAETVPAGEKGAEGASGEKTPEGSEVAPLTAENITLPEGAEISEDVTNEFLGIMNNAEHSPAERAQALIDLQIKTMQGASEAAEAASQTLWDETQTEWQSQLEALPEIGGKNLPQTLAQVKKGLEAVGADADTFAAFDLTGAGNHPAIIKVLHALTKPSVEGKPVVGKTSTAPLSRADKHFGG